MSTTISVLGGVGLFLLGMSVVTTGLKALAGSGLRTMLGKAAATPLSGAFWGTLVTLIVQSSSATTMTTIGLVSAGLLSFSQGLALVFGANVGTTGTGWLIAHDNFASPTARTSTHFASPLTNRFLKLTSLTVIRPDSWQLMVLFETRGPFDRFGGDFQSG